MAIATKAINGKVVGPDGVGWDGGTIRYRLSSPGTVDDAGTEQIIGAERITIIQNDGTVSFNLIPNDIITPTNTVYVVLYTAPNGSKFIEYWLIFVSDPATINIGDVTRVTASILGFSAGTLAALLDTDVPDPENNEVLTWNEASEKWEAMAAAGLWGPFTLSPDTRPAVNAANAYKPYWVRDSSTIAFEEVIYETSTDGVYARWPSTTPI